MNFDFENNCCGLIFVQNWSGHNDGWLNYKGDVSDKNITLLKDMMEHPTNYEDEVYRGMCYLATLTEEQTFKKDKEGRCWDSVLKELGWDLVYKFKNPNSYNVVYIYLYSMNKEKV